MSDVLLHCDAVLLLALHPCAPTQQYKRSGVLSLMITYLNSEL